MHNNNDNNNNNNNNNNNIPLRLPNLNINGCTIKVESSIKFLGVWIDENLTWRDHIHAVENKIAKNAGLLYQGKHYLHDDFLKQIYFAYIHAYLNYANTAWACTHKTNPKKSPKYTKTCFTYKIQPT